MAYVQPPLVLASASPRRRELLAYLGVRYSTLATDAEERDFAPSAAIAAQIPKAAVPWQFHPTLLAWRKASTVCERVPGNVIIGADTIVVVNGDVLNKPRDQAEAFRMLRLLAGRTHFVYTGVTVIDGRSANQPQFAIERSTVTIKQLSDAAILAYVATGDPLDKAGAYGIQGLGGTLVAAVEGSYTNVVGLPLTLIHNLLTACSFAELIAPDEAYHRWLAAQEKEPFPCPPTLP